MRVVDLGRMGYREAWDRQLELADEVSGGAEDALILVEHHPVLTLGAAFHKENLLYSREQYAELGVEIFDTDRGGDVTYHGPGQLVIYPIFDIARHGRDLHKWMRGLEETILVAIQEFGIEGRRFPPHTGVWVGDLKIAAIGIKVRRWVNLHGIALNCDNPLAAFDSIVPCGIQGYGVTSLTVETGVRIAIGQAKPAVVRAFQSVFSSE